MSSIQQEALSCFKQAFSLAPELNYMICFHLGMTFMALQRYVSGIVFMQSAYEILCIKYQQDPSHVSSLLDVLLYLSVGYSQLGDQEKASMYFTELYHSTASLPAASSLIYLVNCAIFYSNTSQVPDDLVVKLKDSVHSLESMDPQVSRNEVLINLLGRQGASTLHHFL
jgi:hypothetical protein